MSHSKSMHSAYPPVLGGPFDLEVTRVRVGKISVLVPLLLPLVLKVPKAVGSSCGPVMALHALPVAPLNSKDDLIPSPLEARSSRLGQIMSACMSQICLAYVVLCLALSGHPSGSGYLVTYNFERPLPFFLSGHNGTH